MYSKEFLRELDLQKHKTIYARISSLQFNESPIETIEGKVTGGSINIDGTSSMRRSCSLTMVAQDVNISDYYWGLNTKFKLEIGVENTINKNYEDIIWFQQGVYVITAFSTALSTSNYTINISGKDKMCLLNGEVGGTINSSVDFGKIDEIDEDGNVQTISYPIKDIIRDSVHQYGGEPFHNIIINDVDDIGLELLEYRYDIPMYLLREQHDDTYFTAVLEGETPCWLQDGTATTVADLAIYDSLVSSLTELTASTIFTLDQTNPIWCCAAKIEYGQTAGYRSTPLTYAGELVANIGASLTSILDKIVNMLGNFEYFYDLDGRFVFQRKKTYINTTYSPITSTEDGGSYVEPLAYASGTTYNFTGSELITAFNNAPNLSNLRNDYSVWGTRKSVSGQELPVHMRYAIDEKPVSYTSYDNITYSALDGIDWREIIYQMSIDYRRHNHDDDFALQIAKRNKEQYPTGMTGYEQYYIDLEGFWRDLYYPKDAYNADILKLNNKIKAAQEKLAATDNPAVKESLELRISTYEENIKTLEKKIKNYYTDGINAGWNKYVYEQPETLNFWFDFLDEGGTLNQFSCKMVGCRPKAVNDKDVKSIYFRETPTIIFTDDLSKEEIKPGYRYFFTSANYDAMFSISAQGKSAKDEIDTLLYNHSYCIESTNITAIPIYYLEPNTRIYVFDDKTGIEGDYIVSRISIPLTYNGTMSITATKAAESLL